MSNVGVVARGCRFRGRSRAGLSPRRHAHRRSFCSGHVHSAPNELFAERRGDHSDGPSRGVVAPDGEKIGCGRDHNPTALAGSREEREKEEW